MIAVDLCLISGDVCWFISGNAFRKCLDVYILWDWDDQRCEEEQSSNLLGTFKLSKIPISSLIFSQTMEFNKANLYLNKSKKNNFEKRLPNKINKKNTQKVPFNFNENFRYSRVPNSTHAAASRTALRCPSPGDRAAEEDCWRDSKWW